MRIRTRTKFLYAVLSAVACHWLISSANALTITDDPGGIIPVYVAKWHEVAESGERVIIDGECTSACTLILGIVPHDRMCVTPNAKFGFHKAFYILRDNRRALHFVESEVGTQFMLSFYPQRVKDWIKAHGGLTRQPKYMPGKESGLQSC